MISDCLVHDTVAVYLFQKTLIKFLKSNLTWPIHHIIYFSDGAPTQYKNRKNFINLCNHQNDFGVPAEWHFFATSHGKGPCDGIGGTVKRLADNHQIMTPRPGMYTEGGRTGIPPPPSLSSPPLPPPEISKETKKTPEISKKIFLFEFHLSLNFIMSNETLIPRLGVVGRGLVLMYSLYYVCATIRSTVFFF